MKIRLEEMTLREKIGQTGMPGPTDVRKGIQECGSYSAYFKKYPFCGLFADDVAVKPNGEKFSSPREMGETFRKASNDQKIPLIVAGDCEYGANNMFDEFHAINSNMSIGAAQDEALTYKRSYYWAREMRSCGINWPFSPVVDVLGNILMTPGIRCMAGDYRIVQKMAPYVVKGIQDAGAAACAKQFPSRGKDYRDPHFSTVYNEETLQEWRNKEAHIWHELVDKGVMSIMTAHFPVPAMDDSLSRGGKVRPGSTSKKIIDLIRNELHFDGVVINDAVSMKGLTSAFEHEDVYIESFNAGNDMILFCNNDYIDVMERAVLDGRVSETQIDASCQRMLDLKEKLGLFEAFTVGDPLTKEEIADFEDTIYQLAKKAATLVTNHGGMIPFDKKKVKRVAIINLAPFAGFYDNLKYFAKAFTDKGIQAEIVDFIRSKEMLKQLSENNDILIYACYLAQAQPQGMSFFSRREDISTLFHSMSYGASKSVVVSFGAPSIYYNYFENAEAFINAYSNDIGTMRAVADGILGEFEFTGTSPVALTPYWIGESFSESDL